MIKKIFIVLLLFSLFTLTTIKVQADETFDEFAFIDSGDYWEIYSTQGTNIPIGTEYMEIYLPPLSIWIKENDELQFITRITFVNENIFPVETIYWTDITDETVAYESDGRLMLDFSELSLVEFPNIYDARGLSITFVVSKELSSNYMNDILIPWLNTNIAYEIDGEITLPSSALGTSVIMYNRLHPYFESPGSIPIEPPIPYRFGFDFLGWAFADGTYYEFDEALPECLPLRICQLYAQWEYVFDSTIDEVEVSIPDVIINAIGMAGLNTVGGRTLIYFVLILILTISLLSLKLNALVVITVNFAITSLFMFIGWFPIYISIILGGALLFSFVASLKGGL
jgi:hypothetical protein